MSVEVDDYQTFFDHIYSLAEQSWRSTVKAGKEISTRLQRVYWYEVGSIDQWDLNDAQSQAYLRQRFDSDAVLKAGYMAEAGKAMPGRKQHEVALRAWTSCFEDMRQWYEARVESVEKVHRFHHGVRTSTDLIDILEVGHLRVDLLNRSCEEKGLDTRLAVDMIALEANYDVALLVSGDADSIPSIELMKSRGKHVGAIEFVRGYPPEQRGRGFSSKIKLHADFVTRVYEMDLIQRKVATKAAAKPKGGSA